MGCVPGLGGVRDDPSSMVEKSPSQRPVSARSKDALATPRGQGPSPPARSHATTVPPLLRPWFARACRELKTPWPKAPAGAEAAFGVFDRGPATSPLARSSAAVGLVESSRWAANVAVALRRGRFRCVSVRYVLRDFFGGDRCAAGETSGDDRCARCLYKGALGGGVPPHTAHSLSLRPRKHSLPSSLSHLAALARSVFLSESRA